MFQHGNRASLRRDKSKLPPVMAAALGACCDHWHVQPTMIISKNRTQHVSFVRAIAIYLVRELSQASWVEIGKRFERDHSTMISGYRRAQLHMQARPSLVNTVERLRLQCSPQD